MSASLTTAADYSLGVDEAERHGTCPARRMINEMTANLAASPT